jgi:hypothetical protein
MRATGYLQKSGFSEDCSKTHSQLLWGMMGLSLGCAKNVLSSKKHPSQPFVLILKTRMWFTVIH